MPAPAEATAPPAAPPPQRVEPATPARVEPAPPAKAVPPKDARAPAVIEPADKPGRDRPTKDKPVAVPPAREAPRTAPVDERRPPAESRPPDRVVVPERPAPAPEPQRTAKADTGGEVTLPPRELSEEGRRLYLSAHGGDAGAQNALANMYYNGRGAPQSDAEAVRWWSKAAEQGNLNAQNNLGFMYYSGRGVAKDQGEGARWWLKAAEHGFAAAQNNIGGAYRNGLGVQKNEQEAVKWYRRSAEQGHAGSQKALGDMYYFGLGVPKSEAEDNRLVPPRGRQRQPAGGRPVEGDRVVAREVIPAMPPDSPSVAIARDGAGTGAATTAGGRTLALATVVWSVAASALAQTWGFGVRDFARAARGRDHRGR